VFETARVKELAARKRLLVAESEVNRRLLAVELARLQPAVAQAEKAASIGRAVSPILLTVAAVAGGFLLTKGNSLKGLGAKALVGWQLFKRLKPLWDRWRAGKGEAEQTDRQDGEPAKAPAESA
jgi:hypothetical protein